MPANHRRPSPVAALGLAAVIAATAGCTSSGRSAAPPTSSSTASTQTSTTRATTFSVPSQGTLQRALLTLRGAGEPFTGTQNLIPAGEKQSSTGCPALDNGLFNGSGNGVVQAQAGFEGGQTGPFLTESLASEPEAQFDADAAQTLAGLSSCRTVTITRGASTETLTLTPDTTFPAGAAAARFSTTVSTTGVVGDLAAEQVGNAFLIVLVADLAGHTTVDAQTLFTKARQKAQTALAS